MSSSLQVSLGSTTPCSETGRVFSAMITLQSDSLLVRIEPAHGAEIIDFVDRETGRQLLGRPPFVPHAPLVGDLSEDVWTTQYRGGWQLLTPNAGNSCIVGSTTHGFHGAASNGRWTLLDTTAKTAHTSWTGHGLDVQRKYLVEDSLSIETSWTAVAERTPFIAVEHVALGLEVLDPEVDLILPGGRGYELSEQLGAAVATTEAPFWPNIALFDAPDVQVGRFELAEARSRLLGVAGLPEGTLEVRNRSSGQGIRLEWDIAALPYLWLWDEVRTSQGLWGGATELLIVEPASVPHSLGLERAIADGAANWLNKGDRVSYQLRATALR